MKKRSLFDNKYIAGIAVILVCLLGMEIFLYGVYKKESQIEVYSSNFNDTENITREGFSDPLYAANYLINAYKEKNLDKILRVSAINGKTYGMSLARVLEESGEFSYGEYSLPSNRYEVYVPLSRNIITNQFLDMYQEFQKQAPCDVSDIDILKIDYINPKQQISPEYSYQVKLQCETWGASNIADIMVLFKNLDDYYIAVFRFACYESNWYLFDNNSELIDDNAEHCIREITEDEYEELAGDEPDKEALAISLGIDSSLTIPVGKSKEILPLNYKISNQIGGETASEVLNSLVLALRKGNTEEFLCYSNLYEESGNNLEEIIERQAEISEELQRFYYTLMIRNLEDNTSLEELQMTGSLIESWVDPWLVRYMTLVRAEEYQIDENNIEMLITFRYNNEEVQTGWTFIKGDEGWKLQSLGAQSLGFDVGEIV